ncbi:hypothetical protein T261_7036 [Streptomyces lydicus]|nr:hypothetical protein T261_7036 [Streptomyces lydicus]
MVRDAQPDKVDEIADHWMYVHDQLAGDASDGCVQDLLDKAVADVLEYWDGAAADAFAKRAKTLSTSLKHSSLYAKNTSHVLKAAAIDLREAKRAVTQLQDTESVRKEGNWLDTTISYAKDGVNKAEDWISGRDDSGLNRDIAKGMSADEARAKHADSLSRGREIALQAAAHMEKLGASYDVKARQLVTRGTRETHKPIPLPAITVPPPTAPTRTSSAVASPRKTSPSSSAAGSGATGGAAASGGLRSPHATKADGIGGDTSQGGTHQPMPKGPRAGTALDGVRGGVPTHVPPPATSPGGPVVGETPGSPGPGSGPGGPGIPPGVGPVVGGRGPSGGGGIPRSTTPGVKGTTPTPGGRAGSKGPGAPGAPGQQGQAGRPPIGGGVGSGGSGKSGSRGRQGGLARRPGGVVGEPAKPGLPGRGAQGGSGLHRSRGGALQSGPEGASRARGPMGVPPVGRSERGDRERRRSSRPDYLIEDEETWAPQRDVVPGVVGLPTSEGAGDADVPEERNREAGPESSEGSGRA